MSYISWVSHTGFECSETADQEDNYRVQGYCSESIISTCVCLVMHSDCLYRVPRRPPWKEGVHKSVSLIDFWLTLHLTRDIF